MKKKSFIFNYWYTRLQKDVQAKIPNYKTFATVAQIEEEHKFESMTLFWKRSNFL